MSCDSFAPKFQNIPKSFGMFQVEKEVAVGFPHNKGVLKPMCLMYELATGKKILEQHIQTFDEMFND